MAKVLIADDDPQVLQVLTTILQGAGHAVLAVQDGRTAWETFQKERPDAVIADVLIPSIAGSGLSHRVKKDSPAIGVILVSGVYTDPTFHAEATGKYKADELFLKPFTKEQILNALGPLLKRAAAAPKREAEPEAELVLGESTNPGSPVPGEPEEVVFQSSAPKRSISERAAEASKAAEAVKAAMAAAGIGKVVKKDPPPETGANPAAPASGANPAAPAGYTAAHSGGFAPEGNLERSSPIGLLYRCASEKLAGKLTFKKDVATKEIWVKDGKIAHATSNLEADRLEYKLLEEKKITGDQYREVGILAPNVGGVEMALIRMNLVPPGEIFEKSKAAAIALVLDVFKWLGGKYQWQAGVAPPAGAAGLGLDIEEMLGRGLKEAFDLDRLTKAFGPRMKGPLGKDLVGIANVDKLKLTPGEFRLTRMIDGKKSPEVIAKEFGAGDAAKELRALQVIFLMSEAGMLRLEEMQVGKTPTGGNKPVVDLDALKKKLDAMAKQNYFEVLGLMKGSGGVEAKKAYFALARQFHPDTLPVDASPEHRKLIEGIFSIISRANTVLEDPKQREDYLLSLEVGGGTEALDPEALLKAELEFQKGEFFLLKKKDPVGAEPCILEALRLNPKEAEHHILYGWLVYVKSKGVAVDEAKKHIEGGLKMRDNVANGWLFLGHIAKAAGKIDRAEQCYRKVVTLDEKNQEAMSELRVIAMRKKK